jgi:hypothetical protein
VSGSPLAVLMAVVMAGVACFHAGRLTLAVLWRRPTHVDVDVVHIAMGVAMAGMLVGWPWGEWNDVWIAIFAVSSVWFGRKAVREMSDSRTGVGIAHQLAHLVGSLVMLYMLWAMRWTSMAGMGTALVGRADHVAGGATPLSYVLGVLVVANAASAACVALFSGAGPSRFSRHRRVVSTENAWGTTGAHGDGAELALLATGHGASEAPARSSDVLGFRGALGWLVAMSVVMAYMVVAARP